MNFSYGIIGIVGVLAAISIGFIAMDPNYVIEPRTQESDTNKIAQIKKVLSKISVNPSLTSQPAIVGDSLVFEVEFSDDDTITVDHVNYDVSVTQDGDMILSDPASHRHPGKHPIHETLILDESLIDIQVVVQGLGHGNDIFGPRGIVTNFTLNPEVMEPKVMEEVVEPISLPMAAIVLIPAGSAVPGCEDTDECYLPYEVTVAVGATVSWSNDDSAAHTVTSGIAAEGADGIFDSSLFMSNGVFEFTFNDVGTYDYYCMVHPWMTGVVNVN